MLLVFAGGVAGTFLRYLAEEQWPAPIGGWPWATWAVNIVGSMMLGVLMGLISRHRDTKLWAGERLFLGVGFCGGLTTYSAFALEVNDRWVAGHLVMSVGYAAATIAVCVMAAAAGHCGIRVALPEVKRR